MLNLFDFAAIFAYLWKKNTYRSNSLVCHHTMFLNDEAKIFKKMIFEDIGKYNIKRYCRNYPKSYVKSLNSCRIYSGYCHRKQIFF